MDRFDPESGQVYRETIIRPDRKELIEWDRAFLGRRTRKFLSSRSADTLTAMVLRKLVLHAEELTPSLLKALPAATVHQIRTAIRREGRDNLHIFKCFAESGHEDKTYRFATSTSNFYKPLVSFFQDLVSPNFSWMVDLNLRDLYCSRLDLRQLSTLQNLQTLWISYTNVTGDEPFDDGVLSHLSFRTSTDNVLSKLAMLFVCNAAGISGQSFASINRFPALDTFCVTGTKIKAKEVHGQNSYGWRISTDPIFQINSDERSARVKYDSKVRGVTFPERVRQSIQKRRSSVTSEFWTLPSAYISFDSRSLGPKSSRGRSTGMMCLERDIHSTNDENDSGALAFKRKDIENSSDKARKVKAARTVDLNKMLDGL